MPSAARVVRPGTRFSLGGIDGDLGQSHGSRQRKLLPLVAINSLALLVLLAIMLRGQVVQGIRHVLWCLFFLMSWNLQALGRLRPVVTWESLLGGRFSARAASRGRGRTCGALTGGLAVRKPHCCAYRAHAVRRVSRDAAAEPRRPGGQARDLLRHRFRVVLLQRPDLRHDGRRERPRGCWNVHGPTVAPLCDFVRVVPLHESQADSISGDGGRRGRVGRVPPIQVRQFRRVPPHFLLVEPDLASDVCPVSPGSDSGWRLNFSDPERASLSLSP